jgi:flagellar basal body-associated protein FliL
MEEQEKQEQQDKPQPEKKKNYNITILLTIILVVLILGLGFLGYLYYTQKQETEKIYNEKIELIGDFQALSEDYSELKTENDSINLQLVQRQVEIQKMINEINTIKKTNAQIIQKYKNELKTLRDIMKSYIVQIDSLNRRNEMLRAENLEVKTRLKSVEETLAIEKEIKEELTEKVEKAEILTAKNIFATGVNDRAKEKDKINKIEKIRVCFTVRENSVAEPGKREIYLRILRPDSILLTNSKDNIFSFHDRKMVYSASREVQYENQDLDVCIYYDSKQEELIEGTYNIGLYSGGHKIGETTMSLRESIGFF